LRFAHIVGRNRKIRLSGSSLKPITTFKEKADQTRKKLFYLANNDGISVKGYHMLFLSVGLLEKARLAAIAGYWLTDALMQPPG
jgi:hypothetical protein